MQTDDHPTGSDQAQDLQTGLLKEQRGEGQEGEGGVLVVALQGLQLRVQGHHCAGIQL